MSSTDKRLTEADLSPDQKACYDSILDWISGSHDEPGLLTFAGFAGCGKTSVVGVLALELQKRKLQVAYAAYTGRASSILGRKLTASGATITSKQHSDDDRTIHGKWGHLFDSLNFRGAPAFVGTIHRLLYRPIIDSRTEELLGWRKRSELDRNYDLLVIDEASMIPDEMLLDLKQHGVPILAVGDHGQLPPVMGSGELMKHPNLRLEKIHRQAEGNPIIRLAHEVRETGRLTKGVDLRDSTTWDRDFAVSFRPKSELPHVLVDAYENADSPLDVAILCWTNKTRIRLNSEARRARGLAGPPKAGDLMLCLKNYPPIFNGMRGILTSDSVEFRHPWMLTVEVEFPEESIERQQRQICVSQINRERPFQSLDEFHKLGINVDGFRDAGDLFDLGYAMTVHKMQGSGVPHVVLFMDREESPSDDAKRFFYTAITRSSERLTVFV